MIEVNLFSVPSSSDVDATLGRCVARARFDSEAMKVNIIDFVRGFLKDNMDNLESALSNSDLVAYINGSDSMTTVDFASVQYLLKQIGYMVTIWNVTDDEENPNGVGAGTLEYNVVNHNFLQHDYPTTTKIVPSEDKTVAEVITEIVEQTGLFDEAKFAGVKNPFTILVNNLNAEKTKTSNINASIVSQIYRLLHVMGFDIFCAASEE